MLQHPNLPQEYRLIGYTPTGLNEMASQIGFHNIPWLANQSIWNIPVRHAAGYLKTLRQIEVGFMTTPEIPGIIQTALEGIVVYNYINLVRAPGSPYFAKMQGYMENEAIVFIMDFNTTARTSDQEELASFIKQMTVQTRAGTVRPFPSLVTVLYNPVFHVLNVVMNCYRSIDIYIKTPKFAC